MPKVRVKLKGQSTTVRKRALIVDADVFVYQAIMDNQLETQNASDEWTYTVDPVTVQRAIKVRVDEMAKVLRAEKTMLCFGGLSNWRKKILPEYKAHRTTKKPLGYWSTVEWCMKAYASKQIPFLEADDIVGIFATNLDFAPEYEKVIVSEDKDLLTIPGQHYNPREPDKGVFPVTQEEATHNHLMQALCGDASDGYKGCPGVGPVKAEEILAAGKLDPWAAIVAAFAKAGLTEDDALVQARVAHILTGEYYDLGTGKLTLWHPKVCAVPFLKRRAPASVAARPAGPRRVARA